MCIVYILSPFHVGKTSHKAPTFLRKLSLLVVVVITDKEADITSVTYLTLLNSTARRQGFRKRASRHGPSFNPLFPFPANILHYFLVKISYANIFLTSGSENNVSLPLERAW